MSQLETLETKSAFASTETGEISGNAWLFAMPDQTGDTIQKGAIGDYSGIPILLDHDPAKRIGTWDRVTETDQGLTVQGHLDLTSDLGRLVHKTVKTGKLTGLSIGFRRPTDPSKIKTRPEGGRTFEEIGLAEISLVHNPAHGSARILEVKSMPEHIVNETSTLENTDKATDQHAEFTKALEGVEKRLDEVTARLNRPAISTGKTSDDDLERKSFASFLRTGSKNLDDLERKALNLGTGAGGGYVTAPTISTTVLEKLTELSPLRQLSSVMSIGTTEVWFPKLESGVTGSWVTEQAKRTESQPTFSQQKISTNEYAGSVPVTHQLIDDAFLDIVGFVTSAAAKDCAVSEGAALLKGDGVNKPSGLLKTPADFGSVTAKKDGTDLLAKLIELHYSLPGTYAARASWLMSRKTMGLIRAAADLAGKGTLWSDSLANGTPASFLGCPVYDVPGMDDLAAEAIPVVFGDIATTYTIVDRLGVEFFSDPYTGSDNGIVKVRFRRRLGGAVTMPEAAKLLKIAA